MITYRVMFCCNDDRGMFTGRVDTIEVGDEIRLVGSEKTLRFDATSVKVGRHSWACRDRQVCVGNIYWDSVSMYADTATLLVQDLLASGWAVEEHAMDGPFAKLVAGTSAP